MGTFLGAASRFAKSSLTDFAILSFAFPDLPAQSGAPRAANDALACMLQSSRVIARALRLFSPRDLLLPNNHLENAVLLFALSGTIAKKGSPSAWGNKCGLHGTPSTGLLTVATCCKRTQGSMACMPPILSGGAGKLAMQLRGADLDMENTHNARANLWCGMRMKSDNSYTEHQATEG